MSIFIDTSGLYALLVGSESLHAGALRVFRQEVEAGTTLWVTSYVLLESYALLQHRIGLEPVRDLQQVLLPMFSVEWVTASLHQRGVRRLLREDRRRLSLVDCVSLELMKQRGLCRVLGSDRHFAEAGHDLLPTSD